MSLAHLQIIMSASIVDFIFPLFLIEGKNTKSEVKSMPGIYRLSPDLLLKEMTSSQKDINDLNSKLLSFESENNKLINKLKIEN